jgi:exopolysaccharide production protein ExoZ
MTLSLLKSSGVHESAVKIGVLPGSPKTMLSSIQWLRAIAAIMVAIHHATYFSDLLSQQSGEGARELWGFSSWFFGIHIFFVVSGFIMIHTINNFGDAGAWRQFLARRLIRVVPLYWLLTTVMVAGVIVSPHSLEIAANKFQYILGSYFFVPVLRTEGDLRPILGQGWTLDYEMFFYFAFAFAVLLPRRWGISVLTLVFAGLAWLGRDLGKDTPIIFTWTDGVILEFLFGVYIGLAFEKNWRLPGWGAMISVLSGVGLVITNLQGPTFLIAGVPATLIVGGFVLGPQLKDSFATGWLARVGDASYSLYLTHVIILKLAYKIWVTVVGDKLPVSVFLISSILAAILVGLLVYHLVERPMTNYLQKKLLISSKPKTPFSVRTVEASP